MQNKTLPTEQPPVFALDNYRILYENSPDMLVSVCASTTKILECNNTLVKTLNTTKNNLIGKSIFSIYHHDCIETVEDAFKNFIEDGCVNNLELLLKNETSILLKVEAVRNVYGEIIYSNSCLRDISNIKEQFTTTNHTNNLLDVDTTDDTFNNTTKRIANSLKLIKDSARTLGKHSKSNSEYTKTMQDIEHRMDTILKSLNEG
ncbi:hypothetical protein PK35_09850 [Tamlana nanhaiensis]|uniref:PAS domain-containing protein n=1 Tax=Neotamlana nanhaiensis TaxID=1382798 RepID=A0A0D7W039_9FLAO|nr:PAS domain-containing protein [Tamlana nanhaiensis]KJD32500.1 hypothetical protein PK35_09850 [Tamlana nanhaiensis]